MSSLIRNAEECVEFVVWGFVEIQDEEPAGTGVVGDPAEGGGVGGESVCYISIRVWVMGRQLTDADWICGYW